MELISRDAARQIALNRESHAKGETARACRGIAASIDMLPAQAPAVKVRKLEWVKSHIKPWSEDWHTTSTGYTIRCADEWGWKWSNSVGAHGHERSPEAAKAAAQADYAARILAALDLS